MKKIHATKIKWRIWKQHTKYQENEVENFMQNDLASVEEMHLKNRKTLLTKIIGGKYVACELKRIYWPACTSPYQLSLTLSHMVTLNFALLYWVPLVPYKTHICLKVLIRTWVSVNWLKYEAGVRHAIWAMSWENLSLVMCDQVRLKPACSTTEAC